MEKPVKTERVAVGVDEQGEYELFRDTLADGTRVMRVVRESKATTTARMKIGAVQVNMEVR